MNELDVGELLDRATLVADAPIRDLQRLEGGVSSLTFAARMEDRRVVIKVAPPGLAPVRNRDVLRQARLLRALDGAPGVRVPGVLFEDDGTPPFFVMEFVAGESYEPWLDVSDAPPSPATVRARTLAAAAMLADLQRVPAPEEPVLGLREELDRWERLYATVPVELQVNQDELYQRLAASLPAPVAPTILHGDYRLGNMQFDGERIAAIIDWEIWSLGDPRTDLAWLLTYLDPVQRFHVHRSAADELAPTGFPVRAELIAAYGVEPPDLPWFEAYCRYKMASTTAALVKQSRRRGNDAPHLEVAATRLDAVIGRGLEILDAYQPLADVAAGEHVDQG